MKTISVLTVLAVGFSFQLAQAANFSKCEEVIEKLAASKGLAFKFGSDSGKPAHELNSPVTADGQKLKPESSDKSKRVFNYGSKFLVVAESKDSRDVGLFVQCGNASEDNCVNNTSLKFDFKYTANDQCQIDSVTLTNGQETSRTLFNARICEALAAHGDREMKEFKKSWDDDYKIELGVNRRTSMLPSDPKKIRDPKIVKLRNIRDNCKSFYNPYFLETSAGSTPSAPAAAK